MGLKILGGQDPCGVLRRHKDHTKVIVFKNNHSANPHMHRRRHGIKCHVDIMSTKDYKYKKLRNEEARKLVVKLAATGRVILTTHARERLLERVIIFNDVINVLLSESMRVSDGELERGSYTYRCSTKKFVVVVGFTVRGDGVIVITVFKADRKA